MLPKNLLKIFLFLAYSLSFQLGSSFPAGAQPVLEGIVREGSTALDYAKQLSMKKPIVKIGLSHNDNEQEIVVRSKDGMIILETETGKDIWKHSYHGKTIFLPFAPIEKLSKIFRIQVASFESKLQAESLRRIIEKETSLPVVVRYSPDRKVYQVRIGEASMKKELQSLVVQLRKLGYSELWITEEFPEKKGNLFIRIVDRDYQSEIARTDSLVVLPMNPQEALKVNGKSYRGYFEIRVYPTGEIKAINIVNLEDYLKGVLPLEMGPEMWPEIEALKAQAVAARTYIFKNRGQFAEEGFDICDTPRCQVYGGKSVEHPLSTQAVDETYGQVAVYDDLPINALYTSTCGGMTEDAINIFPSEKGTYLKAVECYPDRQDLVSRSYIILSSEKIPLYEMPGDPNLLRSLALLLVHGVLSNDFLEEKWNPNEEVESEEIIRLLLRAAALTGMKFKEPLLFSIQSIQDFWNLASQLFSLDKRADLQVSEKDIQAIVPSDVLEGYRRNNRKLIAYLIREEMIPKLGPYAIVPSVPITQEYLIMALSSLLSRFRGFQLEKGSFRSFSDGTMKFISEREEKSLPLSDGIIIFNLVGGIPLASEKVQWIPGDRFLYHLDGEGSIDYLEKSPPIKGSSNDRYSQKYLWEVRYNRETLKQIINESLPAGEVLDLDILKRGTSGRVIELLVKGSAGKFVLRGLHVRDGLKLKETLFTMDKQYDSHGELKAVIFNGKGWGHGVGLCQVGAYGMALRGRDYIEILKWYYRGIDIIKAY